MIINQNDNANRFVFALFCYEAKMVHKWNAEIKLKIPVASTNVEIVKKCGQNMQKCDEKPCVA